MSFSRGWTGVNLSMSGCTLGGALETEVLRKFAAGTSKSDRRCDKLMRRRRTKRHYRKAIMFVASIPVMW